MRTRTPSLAALSFASSVFPSTISVVLVGDSGISNLIVAVFLSWAAAVRPRARTRATATDRGPAEIMRELRGGLFERVVGLFTFRAQIVNGAGLLPPRRHDLCQI